MSKQINDFSIQVATVNGSGSQSSNLILLRSLFRMGLPVSGKNLFPSNIAGLPTWFSIRVNEAGYTAMADKADIFVAINKQTVEKDMLRVRPGGLFLYNKGFTINEEQLPLEAKAVPIDFMGLAGEVSKSIKLKKLLTNMVYVGVLAEMLGIPEDVLKETVAYQFKDKAKVIDMNQQAVEVGRAYLKSETSISCPHKVETRDLNKNKILIDGNTSAALGAVFGGCTFTAWYPITPSSSLAEGFEDYCRRFRKINNRNNYAIIQAEDELSAISMVTGAGWAGARAMTTTSGPGMSLMAECAGLMYFAEVPGVIWNVQRAGPSTGLPTRTMQGDILSSAYLSHGDAKHPLLFPATPTECFDMAQTAFDLSERLQTLIIVMSDLDLGMNYWVTDKFKYPTKGFDRGKVLNKEQLEKLQSFSRYKDVDGDGVPYRTLPGTQHDLAGYFTRGTGHDENAKYTEDDVVFEKLLKRLDKKWETAKSLMPKPIIDQCDTKVGLIAYGTTDNMITELRDHLKSQGKETSYMRLLSFPFCDEVKQFIEAHESLYVIEQNRDGQMKNLLIQAYPGLAHKLKTVLNYDGLPVRTSKMITEVQNG